jgi:hypothetical protein
MNGVQTVVSVMQTTLSLLEGFIADFTDAELLVRPVPGANHAAWQLGNVIAGEPYILSGLLPGAKYPALPEGFTDLHGGKGAGIDSDPGFLTKEAYLKLLREIRSITVSEIQKLTDADLDQPASESMSWAGKTYGEVMLFAAYHTLMHGCQFSVIRRKLGKPVLF